MVCGSSMAGVWRWMAAVVMMAVCLWGSAEGVGGAVSRPRPRPQKRPVVNKPVVNVIDVVTPMQNVDLQQMGGTWYLLNSASKCSFLMNHGTRVEPTVFTVTPPSTRGGVLSVSTKTRSNHECWEMLQVYHQTPTPGRLVLNDLNPERNIHIVIGETDYRSYAVLYYQKLGKITMKLYARSLDVLSEPMLAKFEELAEQRGFGLAYLFPFPTYSHCGSVDQYHTLNCVDGVCWGLT